MGRKICSPGAPAAPRAIWWKSASAGNAPVRIRLGPNTIAWSEELIDAWLAKRAEVSE